MCRRVSRSCGPKMFAKHYSLAACSSSYRKDIITPTHADLNHRTHPQPRKPRVSSSFDGFVVPTYSSFPLSALFGVICDVIIVLSMRVENA